MISLYISLAVLELTWYHAGEHGWRHSSLPGSQEIKDEKEGQCPDIPFKDISPVTSPPWVKLPTLQGIHYLPTALVSKPITCELSMRKCQIEVTAQMLLPNRKLWGHSDGLFGIGTWCLAWASFPGLLLVQNHPSTHTPCRFLTPLHKPTSSICINNNLQGEETDLETPAKPPKMLSKLVQSRGQN